MQNKIIINGVEVSECKRFYRNASHTEHLECIDPYCKGFCKDNPNCYYKQLQRKEQECNELKEEIEYSHNQNIRWAKAWTKMWRQRKRYQQALGKIDTITNNISNYLNIGCDMDKCEDCNHFKPFCTNQCVCYLIGQGQQILDIINKVNRCR